MAEFDSRACGNNRLMIRLSTNVMLHALFCMEAVT